jgi:hypothetical protein
MAGAAAEQAQRENISASPQSVPFSPPYTASA